MQQEINPSKSSIDTGVGLRIGPTLDLPWLKGLAETRVRPLFLGFWAILSIITGGLFTFIWLAEMLRLADFNIVRYLRTFFVLQVDPPPADAGLSLLVPLEQGGWWLMATFFLTICILAWDLHLWERARANNLRPTVAIGYLGAIVLYLVIYLIRPVVMGSWAEAPSHGLKAILDWTNNVSVRYGNFYYNPFHMLSIFFLLGSTLLLSMHGATILATEKYGSEYELDEAERVGPGTERAQLFWRWTMGFNANAYSIHLWAFYFAILCGVTGAIGVLLSGDQPWQVNDWFQWGVRAGIVFPDPGGPQTGPEFPIR
jgi:photosynthetic reaction center M subunit